MRTRTLHLIKGLGRGGAEHIAAQCALIGDRMRFGHEVAYLLPAKDAYVTRLSSAGVPTYCLGDGGSNWPWALRHLVEERQIGVVHAHSPIPAVAARLLVSRPSVRIVYTEHNVWNRYHPGTRWANAATFGRNDYVFAVSEAVRRSIVASVFGRRAHVVETLVHGLAPGFAAKWASNGGVRAELGIDDEVPLVVTVANFKPFKGHEYLLRAAVIVQRMRRPIRFVLVGVGPTQREMRRVAADLGLDDTVVFAGFRDDAPRLVAAADVFVLPSEHEGLPIALLEAMALGRSIVATNVGGVPDVITDGKEGCVVPPRDPEALAGGILALLDDHPSRRAMAAAAQERAEAFDITHAVRRMETVYEELLS